MPDEHAAALKLLRDLVADPAARARFRADPRGVAEAAGLSEVARQLAERDGDLQALEPRESRSGLAGVLVAAAVEGLALGGLLEHAPAAHAVSPARVRAPWSDDAGSGSPPAARGSPDALPAAASNPSPSSDLSEPETMPSGDREASLSDDGPDPPSPEPPAESNASVDDEDDPDEEEPDEDDPDEEEADEEEPDEDEPDEEEPDEDEPDEEEPDEEEPDEEEPDEEEPDEEEPDEEEPDEEEPDDIDDVSEPDVQTSGDDDELAESDSRPEEQESSAQADEDARGPDVVPSGASEEYPGDDAPRGQVAAWMASRSHERGLPPQLPVMAALVESGLKNLDYGDADSVGFFQMRSSIWNRGEYAGYPNDPEKQLDWFLDAAERVKAQRVATGKSLTDSKQFGEWIADVERPAAQYRGRYQLKLDEANGLLAHAPSHELAPRAHIDPDQFGLDGSGGKPDAEARALLENDNVVLDRDGVADIKAGRIDPRIVGVLTKLSRDHKIVVSCMCSDHPRLAASGFVSNHTYGRGMDIASIDGQTVGPGSSLARKVASELSRLAPSIRPDEIGSPFSIGRPGYFTDAAHQNHIHVGFKQEITRHFELPDELRAHQRAGARADPNALDGAMLGPGRPHAGRRATAALTEARKYLGTPYRWGGSTPRTGFDCSGLVQWAYAKAGISIPRVTDQQFGATGAVKVGRAHLLPGDLVFFRDSSGYIHHVGISLGGDRFLHAPHTGDVVKISSLDESYYAQQFAGGRRFEAAAGGGGNHARAMQAVQRAGLRE